MALVEGGMESNSMKMVIPIIIIAVIILSGIIYSATSILPGNKQSVECTVPSDLKITYDKPELQDAKIKNSFWACNGLVCNRLMTPQEWVSKFCYSQNGQNLCVVRTAQGNLVYPLDNINVSAVRECAEYLCQQEVLVRNASYIIPAT
jgi:hypothetical protein